MKIMRFSGNTPVRGREEREAIQKSGAAEGGVLEGGDAVAGGGGGAVDGYLSGGHCRRVGWGGWLRGEDRDVEGDGGLLEVDDVAPVEVVLGLGLAVPSFGIFLEKDLVEQGVVVAGYEDLEGVWL